MIEYNLWYCDAYLYCDALDQYDLLDSYADMKFNQLMLPYPQAMINVTNIR